MPLFLRTARRIVAVAIGSLALGAAAQAAMPTARDFARDSAIQSVSVSPDGKHIAAIRGGDGVAPVIAVWDTDAPNRPPAILGAVPQLRIMGVGFVKNDRLAVQARQLFDIGSTRGHLFQLFITDLQGKDWKSALPDVSNPRLSEDERLYLSLSTPEILDRLPNDPRHILVENTSFDGGGDVYKVDIYAGVSERFYRGSDRFGGPLADLNGEIRARQEQNFQGGKAYIAQWIRNPDSGAWEEHFRSFAKDRQFTSVVGFTSDPNIVYISATHGRDKTGLYEYDLRQRKILDPLFEHKLFEANEVIQSRAPADLGRVLGFRYGAETEKVYWVDDKLAAISKGLNAALKVTPDVMEWTDTGTGEKAKIAVNDEAGASIVSWSDDLNRLIVEKSGPNQPPEYYLLTDGTKLTLLGKSRPSIDPATLGDSKLVQYTARDGLVIPALLHLPPKGTYGEGPYPAVILPHGGPWGRDELDWDFSGWTKYLTSRGYVVIQPQFRGSEGWGQKLWRAGDAEWGQKMQDDNDDAAKWLIAQKLAAPDRIALFGYSYGGYAAFAAAIRPNGLYQCAIAGAGVAEIKNFQGDTYKDRFLREFQRPTIEGLDPLPHAKDVSIPMFIYNGDRDQTVPPSESHHFVSALKSAGKPYKYLEIKDMGHQYVTMKPEDLETQLVEIEKYLKNDCGPGGL